MTCTTFPPRGAPLPPIDPANLELPPRSPTGRTPMRPILRPHTFMPVVSTSVASWGGPVHSSGFPIPHVVSEGVSDRVSSTDPAALPATSLARSSGFPGQHPLGSRCDLDRVFFGEGTPVALRDVAGLSSAKKTGQATLPILAKLGIVLGSACACALLTAVCLIGFPISLGLTALTAGVVGVAVGILVPSVSYGLGCLKGPAWDPIFST